MHLSLIIPVYNEQGRIASGITTVLNYLKSQKFSWELIIVDDGSIDKTIITLLKLKSKIKNDKSVFLLRTQTNFGKGHAIRVGVQAAEGDYIIFSDIDLSVPIETLSLVLKNLPGHDVVIGSRRLHKSNVSIRQPKLREVLGQSFTKLSNLILGLDHTDFTCGFKGFKSEAAKQLFTLQKINRWAFDSEVLFLANRLKYKVKEIPVAWKNDPNTKVNLLIDMFRSAWSLLLIRLLN